MSEANKAVVTGFVEEFWNRGNVNVADELLSPDATVYLPTGEAVDRDALKRFAVTWRSAFPDWHATTEELVAEADRVVERWTARGTHRGELRGTPPTGRAVTASGTVYYRITDGIIDEFRGQFDMTGLLQKIGAVPMPESSAR